MEKYIVMKRHYLVLAFLTLLAGTAAAQPTAQTPVDGSTYYIYNVGQGLYMANDGEGGVVLSSAGIPVTLTTADATVDTWYLTSSDGRISATVLQQTRCDGTGLYDQWKLVLVADGKYNIAMRNSGVNAYSYLEYSDYFGRPVRNPFAPDESLTDAQWIFVSPADYEQNIVTLDETSVSYSAPAMADATVRLKRSFSLNMWNSFCVPFDISASQLQSQLGTDVKVAAFTGCTETTLQFSSVSDVEAGRPYLVKPTKDPGTDGYYEFTGISAFGQDPVAVSQGDVDYVGSFVQTTAPEAAYVLRKNEVYHLVSPMTMKGFRAYFVDNSAEGKLNAWSLDDVTAIDDVAVDGLSSFDVYSIGGQKLRSGVSSTDGLPQGVYIVNGKKVVKR